MQHHELAPVLKKPAALHVNIRVLLIGIFFGTVLVKGQVVSWYQIQAMFRFESFHMYGIIGSAVVVGRHLADHLKRMNAHSIDGQPSSSRRKSWIKAPSSAASLSALGWAITGACPAPIYAQLGSGTWLAIVTLLSAFAGAYIYGALRPRLPT